MRKLAALALLLAFALVAMPASARPNAYQSFNRSGRGGATWQGYSPTWLVGLKSWLRADLGVTTVVGPVTATGTTPPTVTLSGTPTATQTLVGTPFVELDCTTLGARGTSLFTVKVNGTTTATNVASAASGVVLTGSGLTAGWAVGVSATNDVYTSNLTASAWADQSGNGTNFAQATGANQPIVLPVTSAYGGAATFGITGTQFFSGTATIAAQPIVVYMVAHSTVDNTYFCDGVGGHRGATSKRTNSTTWAAGNGDQGNLSATFAVGVPTVMNIVNNGASSALYAKSPDIALATGNSGAQGMTTWYLSSFAGGGSNQITGNLAEVVLLSSLVDPALSTRQFIYEGNRYGVPVSR